MKAISPIFCAALLVACSEQSNPLIIDPIKSANSESEKESCITPIEGLNIEPLQISVSAITGQHVDLPSGSSIEIPPNAFVDLNGKPVQGQVDIEWNEYHSLTEIMFSGIPMKYDSAGVQNDLVSGGMFKIKGSQNGQQVNIAPGKDILVNINSQDEKSQFNFYELDESKGSWDYITTKKGEQVNEVPSNQVSDTEDKYDYLHLDLNLDSVPEVDRDQLVCWKTKRKLKTKEEVILKTNPKEIYLNHNERGEITINYRSSYPEAEIVKCEVTPHYLSDAKEQQSKIEENLEDQLESILAFNRDIRAGKVTRSISITGFGTYNWDCVHKWSAVQEVFAYFSFPQDVLPEQVKVFYVCAEDKLIINAPSNGGTIKFNPQLSARLVAILPGNKLFVSGQDEFSSLKSTKKDKAVFQFNDVGVSLKDPSDINDYLYIF